MISCTLEVGIVKVPTFCIVIVVVIYKYIGKYTYMSSDNEIDSIIDQLKADAVPAKTIIPEPEPLEELTDENVGDYVYKKSASLVESTLGAVQALKDNVLTGSDPREISALSQLINSATKALDQLNKINIQNKQSKNNIEVKKMEIAANADRPQLPNTTNVLIATRDEIMSQIFNPKIAKKEKLEILDADFEKH
jgi:hypothetical protein